LISKNILDNIVVDNVLSIQKVISVENISLFE